MITSFHPDPIAVRTRSGDGGFSLLPSNFALNRPTTPIYAEQAIFTSVRSQTGAGYRIIAASGGLKPEERQEITQRSPSHASLSDDSPTAEALAVYSLRTGRYCVSWSRHAGVEHTARGGYRVHTHVAVLEKTAYRDFDYHPVRVHSAVLDALGPEPLLEPPANLDPLVLPDPSASAGRWLSAVGIGCDRDLVLQVAAVLLEGQPLVVVGAKDSIATLDAAIAVLPLAIRTDISISVGMRFSPARQTHLTLLAGDDPQARQLTRGRNVHWLDVSGTGPSPAQPTHATGLRTLPSNGSRPGVFRPSNDRRPIRPTIPTPTSTHAATPPLTHGATPALTHPAAPVHRTPAAAFPAWLDLARRWWTTGRRRDLCRLAAGIDAGVTAATAKALSQTPEANAGTALGTTTEAVPEATPGATLKQTLERIATICNDADSLANADYSTVQTLTARYAGYAPVNPLEWELVRRLLELAQTHLRPRP